MLGVSDTQGQGAASCKCSGVLSELFVCDGFHLLLIRCQGAAEGERSYRSSTGAVEARRESGIQSTRRRCDGRTSVFIYTGRS